MLNSTSNLEAGLIAYGVFEQAPDVYTYCAVYGDSQESTEELIETVTASELTDEVEKLDQSYPFSNIETSRSGNHTSGMLVRYQRENSIYDTMISHRFFPIEPIRVKDGREYWTVTTPEDRDTVVNLIDDITENSDADIRVEKIISSEEKSISNPPYQKLSERQREIFELAQQNGYYSWPRETSAAELAEKVDISKATLLEHLRKAEAKLLDF